MLDFVGFENNRCIGLKVTVTLVIEMKGFSVDVMIFDSHDSFSAPLSRESPPDL